METKGKFIVFEGIDGSGKSTQLEIAARRLRECGFPVYETREPTDLPIGRLLRSCLTGGTDAGEEAVAALFAADRLEHIRRIGERLDCGEIVLCDRYYYSSFAYNGGFVPLEWVIELNRPAVEKMPPDLTVYIDLPPEESMKRVCVRGATERYETLERQKKIYSRYREIFQRFPRNVVEINGGGGVQAVSEAVFSAIKEVLEF